MSDLKKAAAIIVTTLATPIKGEPSCIVVSRENAERLVAASIAAFEDQRLKLTQQLAERDAELAAVRADCAEFRAVICELIDAEHYDHFESWLNEGEMKAINKMRAIADRQKGGSDERTDM